MVESLPQWSRSFSGGYHGLGPLSYPWTSSGLGDDAARQGIRQTGRETMPCGRNITIRWGIGRSQRSWRPCRF